VAAVFLLPSFLAFLAVQGIPAVTSLVLSVSDWNIIDPPKFVGLRNFAEVFRDAAFFKAAQVTALLTVGLEIANTLLGLLIAIGLNRSMRFKGIYRTFYFLPLVTAWAAVAIVWRYLYSNTGPINFVLESVGLDPVSFLSAPSTAMAALLLTITWKTVGWKVIILLAGLQAIPRDVYEASKVDGATPWQQFRSITLPLLSPSLFVALVIGIINTLQIFDPIYIMTQGGPADTTKTLGYLIYSAGFEQLRMGYAAALSWTLFMVIMVITLFQWWLQKKWVFYD
jgi:ABC-type sugar transport system permease subunit